MLMPILSIGARRRRGRGRLFLTILAGGLGLSGGAWAASMAESRSRAEFADGLARDAARGVADMLYDLADRPRLGAATPIALAGGPPSPRLRILVTDAWASPGSRLPMPAENLSVQGS